MFECFQEIAFEAELSTKEDPELIEYAQEICNESPDTRDLAIAELRKMIYDRGECNPMRTDDEFLLRFLRARDFIVPRAHRLLVRYCDFRTQYKQLYEGVELWGLGKVKDTYAGTLYDRPDVGRITILSLGRWDLSEPMNELIKSAVAAIEIGLRQPKLQVFGSTMIIDLEGVSLKHVTLVTPTISHQLICIMGHAIPVRVRACHVINYSWAINTSLFFIKRLIPRQAWANIHFHGSDLSSLHQHVDLECLPPRYGGTCKSSVTGDMWLKKIKKYRDEEFDSDMKQMGYVIKE